jgi:hypothetical protein
MVISGETPVISPIPQPHLLLKIPVSGADRIPPSTNRLLEENQTPPPPSSRANQSTKTKFRHATGNAFSITALVFVNENLPIKRHLLIPVTFTFSISQAGRIV